MRRSTESDDAQKLKTMTDRGCELIEVAKNDNRVCLVFEQLNRTVLDEIQQNRRIQPPEVKKLVYQMMRACAHMHERGIVHRDLKPENILIDFSDDGSTSSIKMIDFGFAKIL